ncbi:MAG: M6 family metalloprotease domain-containing protein, partial [Clostridia bacterium]|nr:M6 family metalloprotease domain-containing protein [Clostridia bacterium]
MKKSIKALVFVCALLTMLCACLFVSGAVGARPGAFGGTTADAAAEESFEPVKTCMSGRECGAGCKSKVFDLVTPADVPARSPALIGGKSFAPALTKADKNLPLVIIVVGFKDVAYEPEFDWAQEIFKTEYSLSQYYTDMSFGQFTFVPAVESSAYGADGNTNLADAVNDGVVHVSLPMRHDDWTTLAAGSPEERSLVDMVAGAINAADAYVDFASYDADGDGVIENNELALGLVVAGLEGSNGWTGTDALWAHAWDVAEYAGEHEDYTVPSPDGVEVSAYISIAEQLIPDSQEPISVLAHELGHYLGLPDLYDVYYTTGYEWSDYACGPLSVMASGSWGTDLDGNYRPYSMDAWSRYVLGWISPQTADEDGVYTVASSSGGFSTVLVPTLASGEYYLLEDRVFEGWDEGLGAELEKWRYEDSQDWDVFDLFDDDVDWRDLTDPLGWFHETEKTKSSGVVIWHVDDNVYDEYNETNQVNVGTHRPTVMPLYPEFDPDGTVGFINDAPDLYDPFYTSDIWQKNYAGSLGAALDLPIYMGFDRRYTRAYSGTRLTFLDPEGGSIRVGVELASELPEPYDAFVPDLSGDPSVVAYGACGYGAWWKLSTDGVLTIAGDGDMFDFNGFVYDVDEDGSQLETGASDTPWFDHADGIKSVVVENGVTTVGQGSFDHLTALETVSIADSVFSVGHWAFMDCESLVSVTLPASVTSLGQAVFAQCLSLEEVSIPEGVESIPAYAFMECGSLGPVELPEGVNTIDYGAFYSSGIREIRLPSTMHYVVDFAFDMCSSLVDVYYNASVDEWTNNVEFGVRNNPLFCAAVHCSNGDVEIVPSDIAGD